MCEKDASKINSRVSLVTSLTTAGDLITEIAIIYHVFHVHDLAMSAMAIFFLEVGKYIAKFSLPFASKLKKQKEYLLFTQIFSGLVVLILYLLITKNAPLYLLWFMYIIHSCFSEQFDVIKEAYSQVLAKPYGKEFQKKFQTSNSIGRFSGRLLGTSITLILLSTNNYALAFAIDALTFFVGSLILYGIIPKNTSVISTNNKTQIISLTSEKLKYLFIKVVVNIIPVTIFNYMIIIFIGENYQKDIIHTATTYITVAAGAFSMSLLIKYTKFGQRIFNSNMLATIILASSFMALSRLIFANGNSDTFSIGLIALLLGGCANVLNYNALAVIRRNICTTPEELTKLISTETFVSMAFLFTLVPALYLTKSLSIQISNFQIIVASLIPLLGLPILFLKERKKESTSLA